MRSGPPLSTSLLSLQAKLIYGLGHRRDVLALRTEHRPESRARAASEAAASAKTTPRAVPSVDWKVIAQTVSSHQSSFYLHRRIESYDYRQGLRPPKRGMVDGVECVGVGKSAELCFGLKLVIYRFGNKFCSLGATQWHFKWCRNYLLDDIIKEMRVDNDLPPTTCNHTV